ncbi:MAG: hypothetical protein A2Z74_04070 [Chloroflexi bacterium RBG_13_46_9]|nr:MAG: hypothetical protein A2Z74_04070 [Chloroflexi bacterium RBG_13_46_9]
MKKLIIGIILTLAIAVTAVPAFAANGQDPLDHVVISPDPATVAINGGTQQFTVVSQDAENDPITGVIYLWEVVNLGGTIDSTGKFTAGIAAGTYLNTVKVTASKGGITKYGYADVIVAIPGVLDHVVISPDTATIQPFTTQQYLAVAQDAFNTNLTTNISFAWEVVGSIGTIDATGLFTAGLTSGTFADAIKVTATQTGNLNTKSDTADVKIAVPGVLDKVVISPDKATVTVGGNQQFTAVAKDAYNQTISTVVTYQWSLTGAGSIDQTGKYLAGTTPGTATVTVKASQVNGSITVEKTASAVITVVAEAEEHEGRVPAGWSHGKKNGWDGGSTPPGWSKGKKTGWDGKDSPPGLLKANDEEDED